MNPELSLPNYVDDLGNGLSRRWSTAADEAKIGACLATVFRDKPDDPPNQAMINRLAVLFSPGQPLMGPGDFAVVEDTNRAERPIVACACLWSQCWSYGGIPFGLGRPEYVATLPEYRNRGLMRAVFEMLHRAARHGATWYRRLRAFPITTASLGMNMHWTWAAAAPFLLRRFRRKRVKSKNCVSFALRESDVREIKALYDHQASGSLVWTEMTEERWLYYIKVWDIPAVQSQALGESGPERRLFMILDSADRVCGMAGLATTRRGGTAYIGGLVMAPNGNWQAAMPSLLRAFVQAAADIPYANAASLAGSTPEPVRELAFNLDRFHPANDIWGDRLASTHEPPYAWYVRVEDVPRFLHHVAPILEQRLAESVLAGYTGELKIDFYRGGLRLKFEKGRMMEAAPWRVPPYGDEEQGGCPPLVFLQLLFGHRSLAELRASYPDVWTTSEAALLVNTLFPKQPSSVWSLGYT